MQIIAETYVYISFHCSMYQNHLSGHAGTAQLSTHREYWLTQPDTSLQEAQLPWFTADGIVQEAWWGTDGKGYGAGSELGSLQGAASAQGQPAPDNSSLGQQGLGPLLSLCRRSGGSMVCAYVYTVLIS